MGFFEGAPVPAPFDGTSVPVRSVSESLLPTRPLLRSAFPGGSAHHSPAGGSSLVPAVQRPSVGGRPNHALQRTEAGRGLLSCHPRPLAPASVAELESVRGLRVLRFRARTSRGLSHPFGRLARTFLVLARPFACPAQTFCGLAHPFRCPACPFGGLPQTFRCPAQSFRYLPQTFRGVSRTFRCLPQTFHGLSRTFRGLSQTTVVLALFSQVLPPATPFPGGRPLTTRSSEQRLAGEPFVLVSSCLASLCR